MVSNIGHSEPFSWKSKLSNNEYRYKIKEHEALAFADFIMPQLEYYPDKRISAQELLKHPWLNMPADFDYYMSEREYQRMIMIKQNSKKEKPDEENTRDVYDSDFDLNKADSEDNDDEEEETLDNDDDSIGEPVHQIHITNYNNSFAAYGQHINLSACDRANPQFNGL